MAEVIPHWLTKRAFLAPNQVAIENEFGDSITFLELKIASKSFARKLAQLDVGEGSHVGILSTNHSSMVVAIHALSYLGAVAVLLNTKLTQDELSYQINDATVAIVLTCDTLEADVKKMEFDIPVSTFTKVGQLRESTVNLQTEISLATVFTIIYTSGTTGFPKGVVHTYGNHWWSAISSALNLGLDVNDKWLATLPLFHVSGLSIFIKSVIYGMPVLLLEKFSPETVTNAIINKGVTIVSVVTVMLQRLINELGADKYPATFRCMLLGGGPAPGPLLLKAKECHIPVFQSYGMTETASQIVTLSPKDALTKIGSAGKSLFPAQLKINNPGADSVGEIFVKGPMVTKGYFNNEFATEAILQTGWLATGDMGYLDEAGYLYVVDRRTDLIISGGENIYPSEIESVLSEMDDILEVGVVGLEDEIWGQVPCACVVRNNKDITAKEIIAYAEKRMANYKIPKKVYFIDHLPRNATNKLVRNDLLKMIAMDPHL